MSSEMSTGVGARVILARGSSSRSLDSQEESMQIPDWWHHDTRYMTPPKTTAVASQVPDGITPREARRRLAETSWYSSQAQKCGGKFCEDHRQLQQTQLLQPALNSSNNFLGEVLANCEKGSVTEKLVDMVDKLLASQTAQQQVVKKLLGKRRPQEDLQCNYGSPTKRFRFSGSSTATGISRRTRDVSYQVGDTAEVLRSDRTWSLCHVTEIKKDGTHAVVIDEPPQAQKKIPPEKVCMWLRPVQQEDQEECYWTDDDSLERSSSVARSCFDGCSLSSDVGSSDDPPESEASWPLSKVERRSHKSKIDKKLTTIGRRQLKAEIKTLQKELEKRGVH